MLAYAVRVELHTPLSNSYDKLHAAMEKTGFSRDVVRNKIRYRLPHAEYIIKSDLAIGAVLESVKLIAGLVRPKFEITVCETVDRRSYGLEPSPPKK